MIPPIGSRILFSSNLDYSHWHGYISPSGEIPSCPHNALLEILSRNHARVVPDGFLRDLPVSMLALFLLIQLIQLLIYFK